MRLNDLQQDGKAIDFLSDHDTPTGCRYLELRLKGESHNIAAICATQKAPAVNTDTTFLAGHVNGSQFEGCPEVGHRYKAIAEASGVSTSGAVYMHGLARFPGDPEAWVRGKGDVAKLAEDRGWGVDGAVNRRRRDDHEPMRDIEIGDDIIDAAAEDILAGNPGMHAEEAREQAVKLRTGKLCEDAPRVQPLPAEALDYCPDF